MTGSWQRRPADPKLVNLGIEPLSDNFTGESLWVLTRKQRVAIKSLLMDQGLVVWPFKTFIRSMAAKERRVLIVVNPSVAW